MPNIFSKPIASDIQNNYVSQYVPLPLEQFARAQAKAEATQDLYSDRLGTTSNGLYDINGVGKDDQDYIKSKQQEFDEAATKLANVDLSRRENQDAATLLIKNVARDKDLAHIMSNAAIAREHAKQVDEMMKAGTYQAYNDQFYSSLADYSKNGGYKSGKSLDNTIHKYSEERPKMEEYFNNMGENGAESLGKIGEVYYKTGWDGISNDKEHGFMVNNRANQAFRSYIETPEGQQGIRRYNYMVANNPKLAEQFKGGAAEYVFKEFLDAGLERVHGKSTSGLAAALNKKTEDEKEGDNLFRGLASNEIPSTLLDGLDVKYDSKDNIKGDGIGLFANIKESLAKGNYNPVDMFTQWKNDERLTDEQNTRLKSVKVGAKLNGVSDKEYVKHFNKTWAPVINEPLTGKAIKANNDAFYNGGAGLWSHMILSKDGKGAMGFIEALENEFGTVPDFKTNPQGFQDFMKEHGVQVTGAYAPNKLSARPIEITIGGSTFMADLTNGGRNMNGVSQDDITASNLAKLNAGEQIVEKDSKGNNVMYWKSMTKKDSKGNYIIEHKILPKE